ncbi:hypothetical protein DEO72_LG11g3802 [Vigna unguiculata]|uniref:Outer membrane protein beta-barrel domain-containing protein n=1 Tax=Vigna unguiculata TaxID=3917 RepID=A0A4D6NSF8_VIGUN|nr:hypothetical protein DEO72_LG11g3802 [Vigna unguiculata]
METSLRYGEDSKALRIHAKEKLAIFPNTYLQVHGELDTKFGQPSSSGAFIRYFNPNLSSTLGFGLRYDKREKLRYTVNAKKTYTVGVLNFKVKGASEVEREFKEGKSRIAAEVLLNLFNFKQDQDIRLKIGCEYFEKVPYLQIRENNWTINADYKGRWNVRYDL